MLNRLEPACLVIADISGYTSYIAGTELDLIPLIAQDAAGRRATGLEAGEPELPASAERFLREPIRSVDVDSPPPRSSLQ